MARQTQRERSVADRALRDQPPTFSPTEAKPIGPYGQPQLCSLIPPAQPPSRVLHNAVPSLESAKLIAVSGNQPGAACFVEGPRR